MIRNGGKMRSRKCVYNLKYCTRVYLDTQAPNWLVIIIPNNVMNMVDLLPIASDITPKTMAPNITPSMKQDMVKGLSQDL